MTEGLEAGYRELPGRHPMGAAAGNGLWGRACQNRTSRTSTRWGTVRSLGLTARSPSAALEAHALGGGWPPGPRACRRAGVHWADASAANGERAADEVAGERPALRRRETHGERAALGAAETGERSSSAAPSACASWDK